MFGDVEMKYELEPDNRNCADQVLLDDLRDIANRLAKATLTKEEYDKHGRFHSATVRKRFGTWNAALELSGLIVQKRMNIPHEEMLADLKKVAEIVGTQGVSKTSFTQLGNFSPETVAKRFGSWTLALAAAGLETSANWKPKVAVDELFMNMANVWEHVGRQPKQSDFRPPTSKYHEATYTNRFGSWRKALEAFVEATNAPETADSEAISDVAEIPYIKPIPTKKRTNRNPSWRLRFLVHRRDKFRCCACGTSPASQVGVTLVIDHIKAWSDGGETVIDNLQTLCEPCNGGKSDLAMTDDAG